MPAAQFLSTPSARRATPSPTHGKSDRRFLSTPSARRATHAGVLRVLLQQISIHALREEGDHFQPTTLRLLAISIHALREEGDCSFPTMPKRFRGFLSTPSARRATVPCDSVCQTIEDFYPRPPRGGRPSRMPRRTTPTIFLSTPSARRATHGVVWQWRDLHNFYPRPPRGGRRDAVLEHFGVPRISIHALREEGDPRSVIPLSAGMYFYPRPPRGGRPGFKLLKAGFLLAFLSTPSARRATRIIFAITKSVHDFYPRPPRGGRQQKQRQNLYFLINYTTFCTNLEEP